MFIKYSCISILFLVACAEQAIDQAYTLYKNHRLVDAVYWHFSLVEGEGDVYKIDNQGDEIYFEINQEEDTFLFEGNEISASNCLIIKKDGSIIKPTSGKIIGKKTKTDLLKIELDLNFSSSKTKDSLEVYQLKTTLKPTL